MIFYINMTVIRTFSFSSNKRNIWGINLPQKILRWISRFHNTPESHISSTVREIGKKYNKYTHTKKPTQKTNPHEKGKDSRLLLTWNQENASTRPLFFPLTLCSCGILVPQPEIEPGPLAMRAQSPPWNSPIHF